MTIAEVPATVQIRRQVLTAWLDELYERLRQTEARAADERLTPIEQQAAAVHARYLTKQIMRAEQQLRFMPAEVFNG